MTYSSLYGRYVVENVWLQICVCDLHTETLEGIYHRNPVMRSEMPVLGSSEAGCPCQPDIAVCIHRGMRHTGHGAVLETLRYGAFVISAFLMFDSLNHLG